MMTPLEPGGVSHGRPIEVLNFEDDPADALIVERALRKVFLMSFQITTVQRLEEGLRWLREKSFDVALVDLRLRDAHGMETFETGASTALLVHHDSPETQPAFAAWLRTRSPASIRIRTARSREFRGTPPRR